MRNRSRLIGIAAVSAAAAMALSACAGTIDPATGGAGASSTLTLGMGQEPNGGWDAATATNTWGALYYQAPYDTLVRRMPDGSFEPMLATDWEYNDDNTVLTMNLRTDVTFTDGEPFDAEAVKLNVQRFKDGNGPIATRNAGFIDEVEVVDEDTVAIHLSRAEPDLLHYLGDGIYFASPGSFETDLKTVPVGTGPYVMDATATVSGSSWTFTKNPDYWAPELQKYDKVVYNFYDDETAMLNALKSGQIDAGYIAQKANVAEAEASDLSILTTRYDWQGLMMFDRAGDIVPELGDVRVRQAIMRAFDTDLMVDKLQLGFGESNRQVFNEASTTYQPELNGDFSYNLDAAKALMGEAGYADGFTIDLPLSSSMMQQDVVQTIEQGLGELNITVNWTDVGMEYFNELIAGKWPMAWVQFGAEKDWMVSQTLLAEQAVFNPLRSTDPELTAMLDSIPTASEAEAEATFKDIDRWVVENGWFAPWYWIDGTYAYKKSVKVEPQAYQTVPSLYNFTPAS